ncbi:MAG: hypothetical protein EXR72_13570 [Myxococcales bacterium]|nr:hypothetical protein [Myxococcales bacterium]
MRRQLLFPAIFVSSLALAGCEGGGTVSPATPSMMDETPYIPPSQEPSPGGELTVGGAEMTFEHTLDDRDPFDILKQKQEEGSPLVSTRLHSCQKMSYAALGALLTSRGVDLNAKAAAKALPTAGDLYRSGSQALGAPTYLARIREPTQLTTAGATKLMDVFVQAAPEIIKKMPSLAACMNDGQPTKMFAADGTCNLDGVSCLIGAPATAQHVKLCTQLVNEASSTQVGQQLAVAAILAAAHTCE